MVKKKKVEFKKSVHIKSLQASEIVSHINRGTSIKRDYKGMIPYSLELIQLRKEGLKQLYTKRFKVEDKWKTEVASINGLPIQKVNTISKIFTDDIINVKFTTTIKDFDGEIERLMKKINEKPNYKDYYQSQIAKFKELKMEKEWNKIYDLSTLRFDLYKNGFTLNDAFGNPIKYVLYKRSAAKARESQTLFIREELHKSMKEWSHIGLDFYSNPKNENKIDLTSLMSYESLVMSSIESTIKIHPSNILMIDDVESVFTKTAKVISAKSETELQSVESEATIKNSLWDGQSLLESSYFQGEYKERSMLLLRSHFFKSAAFACSIQDFLEDHKPEGIELDDWKIKDMFGNEITSSEIHLITTPSSLKILKFGYAAGSKEGIYNHWKKVVEDEGYTFGIVKSEKESKRGRDFEGNTVNQLSYQMINSLPNASFHDIKELSQFEQDYIKKMKEEDESTFIEYLQRTATYSNSNQMYVDLYLHNNYFAKTQLFKDFKKNELHKYVKKVKTGKLRVKGDYLTLLGNPYEMLLRSIGQFKKVECVTLKDIEVYTTRFKDGAEFCSFRSPHTSAHNILYSKNKYYNELKYFNLSENIICVNSIKFELPDKLSGSDFDSDGILTSIDKILIKMTKSVNPPAKYHDENKYKVCVNNISSSPVSYIFNRDTINNENEYKVDKSLANDYIGKIVNLGQKSQSIYYDAIYQKKKVDNSEEINKTIDEMLEVIEVISVMSGICIDMAKKFYDIKIPKIIQNLTSKVNQYEKVIEDKENKKKMKVSPVFFSYIKKKSNNVKNTDEDQSKKNSKSKYYKYDCPMDYLCLIINNDRNDTYTATQKIEDFIIHVDENNNAFKLSDANRKQILELTKIVEVAESKLKSIESELANAGEERKSELLNESSIIHSNLEKQLMKKSVNPVTMYTILHRMFISKTIPKSSRLLNAIYKTQKNTFLNAFTSEK